MYKVYENHKRKIAPQFAEHKSFLVWDDDKKRVVYSYFVKGDKPSKHPISRLMRCYQEL